ncbi:hypothetical protein [Clostridium tertium]|uniref:hypothetical protein n=1 Tax=Clostridium tertium TaxID=1559 RepID=UPI001AE449C7|nr:hypothetical protein [Clostridium tertium]MBP1869023.1 hypothetical protein [Clostridium tertium]
MNNIKLIYDNVKEIKVDYKKKPIKITINSEEIDSSVLYNIIARFKYLLRYNFCKYDINLEITNLIFKDKITYLILDAIIYDLLKRSNFNIDITCVKQDYSNIHSGGFTSTALYRVQKELGYIDRKLFIKYYEQNYYSNRNTYRKVISKDVLKNDEIPSIIASEVASVVKQISDDSEWVDGISEVVSELVCNVSSHTEGDCLLDINFSKNIGKINDIKKINRTMINIAVINYSEYRLFDKIKNNICNKKYNEKDSLYERIYKAYNNHKNLFDSHYTEDDFFLITAFQNHVTSRNLKSGNNGTGLTRLIENIIGKCEADYSYVLSGYNVLLFRPEYLIISEDRFIGFNKERDYFNHAPSKQTINKSALSVPGTIYNLLLIKEN